MPALLYAGIVGPRGDAYETNQTITAEEAEEYHSEQLATLARAGVDLVEAMTFSSVHQLLHPLEFTPAIESGQFERVRCLRPNAALMDKISLCTLGHLEVGDPVVLGELMGDLARQHPHIDMWGGCCGTWESHLDEIARNVQAARGQSR